jgi:hypothetical protein
LQLLQRKLVIMSIILAFTHIMLQLCKKFHNPIANTISLIGYKVGIATVYGMEDQWIGVRFPASTPALVPTGILSNG